MAYLGNAPARSFISFERQVFTIVNSQTAYTLEKKFNSALKNMDASKFSKGVARIKENQDIKNNVLKIKDGEYKED